MVQNSLGAQWLATLPAITLESADGVLHRARRADRRGQGAACGYHAEPAQPGRADLIDPACGSGHILVEAYELFKAIYLERGYRQRDEPWQLILEKNLFGLDIDERAAQLTGFALMMKGRADDRRLFERG